MEARSKWNAGKNFRTEVLILGISVVGIRVLEIMTSFR